MCAWYEHVWARPHVIHKVRAVFGVPMDMKSSVTMFSGLKPLTADSLCQYFIT